MSNQGLEIVITRNEFYRKNYRSAAINFFLLLIAIISFTSFIIFMHVTSIDTLYFPTTPSGEYIDMPPLNKNHLILTKDMFDKNGNLKAYPEINIKDLGQDIDPKTALAEYWAKNAIVQLFNYDYVNYRRALQDVRDYFTLKGHGDFLRALEFSRNLEAVKNNFQVVSAKVSGKVDIQSGVLNEGSADERAAWYMSIPLEVSYENVNGEVLIQRSIATVWVVRETTLRSPFFGLAIDEINLKTL